MLFCFICFVTIVLYKDISNSLGVEFSSKNVDTDVFTSILSIDGKPSDSYIDNIYSSINSISSIINRGDIQKVTASALSTDDLFRHIRSRAIDSSNIILSSLENEVNKASMKEREKLIEKLNTVKRYFNEGYEELGPFYTSVIAMGSILSGNDEAETMLDIMKVMKN